MQQPPRARRRTVGRVLGALGLWAAVVLWALPGVQASQNFLTGPGGFNATYGTAGTHVDTCLVCHTTSNPLPPNPPRNPDCGRSKISSGYLVADDSSDDDHDQRSNRKEPRNEASRLTGNDFAHLPPKEIQLHGGCHARIQSDADRNDQKGQ